MADNNTLLLGAVAYDPTVIAIWHWNSPLA
jgi:hypothetical protein